MARVGLEDSHSHLQEIKDSARKNLSLHRYKESGSIFVISKAKVIIVSTDFTNSSSLDFADFFYTISDSQGVIEYKVGDQLRIGVVQYYQPWDSYIGLAMDKDELFAPKNLFVKINLLVLLVVLVIAGLFALAIHHFSSPPFFASPVLPSWSAAVTSTLKFPAILSWNLPP